MAETDPTRPLEPWPGYADLNPDERLELFNRKTEARVRATTRATRSSSPAAVGDFELLRQVAPELTADEPDARRGP